MNTKKLTNRVTFLIVLIFLVNFSAMYLHWYSLFWWFDMPMHFLGGFWISLVAIWLFKPTMFSLKEVIRILLIVLTIGVLWEVFEILVNDRISKDIWDWKDTFSDISFDLAGGIFAVIYFFKRIFLSSSNKV